MIYTAIIDNVLPDDFVIECPCGYTMEVDSVGEIGTCSLTPGDPSPIGRCLNCDELVYPPDEKSDPV